jgi:hypothetical protein
MLSSIDRKTQKLVRSGNSQVLVASFTDAVSLKRRTVSFAPFSFAQQDQDGRQHRRA